MGEDCGRGLWERIVGEDYERGLGRGLWERTCGMVCNIVMKWCDNNEYSYFSLI